MKNVFLIFIFVFNFLLFTQSTFAEQDIRGSIRSDTTWTKNDGPYFLNEDVTIREGVTLRIEAGTKVYFAQGVKLKVQGRLDVVGTQENKVIFSTILIDENQDLDIEDSQNIEKILEIHSENSFESIDEELEDVFLGQNSDILDIDLNPEEIQEFSIENITDIDSKSLELNTGNDDLLENKEYMVLAEVYDGAFINSIVFNNAIGSDENPLGNINHAEFIGFKTAIISDSKSNVNIRNSKFDQIEDVAIRSERGKLSIHNSLFNSGKVAGVINDTDFKHSGNIFNTDKKGWNYSFVLEVGEIYTLDNSDGQYIVREIQLKPDSKLRIEAGTNIELSKPVIFGSNITGEGVLEMNGENNNPIVVQGGYSNCYYLEFFRSDAWVQDGGGQRSPDIIRGVNFKDLCGGFYNAEGRGLIIENSTFSNFEDIAIKIENFDNVEIKRNRFENNDIGIEIYSINGENLKIRNNTFIDNTTGVIANIAQKIDVRGNDWGRDIVVGTSGLVNNNSVDILASGVHKLIFCPWIGKDPNTPCPIGSDIDDDFIIEENDDKNPIIIIPGLLGTEIFNANVENGAEEVWPSLGQLVRNIADSQLDALVMLEDGTESPNRKMRLGDVLQKVESTDIFEGLLIELRKSGYIEGKNLFFFGYDWRFGNDINSERLKNKIDDVLQSTNKQKVSLIAHSMGGILLKDYAVKNSDEKLENVFFLGTPHDGAPKAFKALMYGDDMGFSKDILGLNIPFLSSKKVKTIARNMPSVYQLLPTEKRIDRRGGYVIDSAGAYVSSDGKNILGELNQNQIEEYMVQSGLNKNFFENTKDMHTQINDLDFVNSNVYNFAGCGKTKTIDSIRLKRKRPLKILGITFDKEYELIYTNGDNVVPLDSADSIAADINFYVQSSNHSTLPSDDGVRKIISDILSGKNPRDTNTVNTEDYHCGVSGTIISVHSPMELVIHGENGDTWTTESGILNGDPNVVFDVIENEKFAFLPDGVFYTVGIYAEDGASHDDIEVFDVTVGRIDKYNKLESKQFFYDIPIASNRTRARLIIDNKGRHSGILEIDQHGDNIYESWRSSEKFTGKKAEDYIPPITTYDIKNNILSLHSEDIGTGVLRIMYSVDENNWVQYKNGDLINIENIETEELFFFSLDKLGNVEEVNYLDLYEFKNENVGGDNNGGDNNGGDNNGGDNNGGDNNGGDNNDPIDNNSDSNDNDNDEYEEDKYKEINPKDEIKTYEDQDIPLESFLSILDNTSIESESSIQNTEYRNIVSTTNDSVINSWSNQDIEDYIDIVNDNKKYVADTSRLFNKKNMYIGLGVFILGLLSFLLYKKFKNNI